MMDTKYVKWSQETAKQSLDLGKRFVDLGFRTAGLLVEKQAQTAQACVEAGAKQVNIFTQQRDPASMVSAQAKLNADCAAQFSQYFAQSYEVSKEAFDELKDLVEDSLSQAEEQVKQVADISSVSGLVNKPSKSAKKAA